MDRPQSAYALIHTRLFSTCNLHFHSDFLNMRIQPVTNLGISVGQQLYENLLIQTYWDITFTYHHRCTLNNFSSLALFGRTHTHTSICDLCEGFWVSFVEWPLAYQVEIFIAKLVLTETDLKRCIQHELHKLSWRRMNISTKHQQKPTHIFRFD